MDNIEVKTVKEIKDEILKIINESVIREGTDKLISWLQSSDYFTAPASTRFHLACEGGLALHSLHVYKRLVKEIISEYGTIEDSPYSMETLVLCGLMHDLCKVDFYVVSTRNAKNEVTGKWEKVPYYSIDDKLPMVHGSKSQYILRSFVALSREESVAIMSHMGGFDTSVKGGDYAISNALDMYPLALLLHVADMKASKIDEKE